MTDATKLQIISFACFLVGVCLIVLGSYLLLGLASAVLVAGVFLILFGSVLGLAARNG